MQPCWSARTPDGQKADFVKSMLQKCIRLGREGDAVYLVKQLYFGRKRKYFGCDIWRRLIIISVEDVGVADLSMLSLITELEQAAKRVDNHDPDHNADLLMIVQAVLLLCRVPKSRCADNAIHWFDHPVLGEKYVRPDYKPPTMEELDRYLTEEQPKPEPLDAAHDMHDAEGRAMGRGMEHFLEHGAKLENKSDVADFQAPVKVVDPAKTFLTEGGL